MSSEPSLGVLQERLKALEERLTQHETTSLREAKLVEDAVDRARHEVDRRLEAMNEFRDQLSTERSAYVTRDTLDARLLSVMVRIDTVGSRLEQLERDRANLTGRLWSMGVGFGIVIMLANLLLRFVWK